MTHPPLVLDEWTTLRAIAERRLSLARFGDGEWKMMHGHDCRSHEPNQALGKRLRQIARAGSTDMVAVAIPRIYDGIPKHKRGFWARYATPERARYYDPAATYYSQFVTRLDFFPALDCPEFWAAWRRIWEGRPVLYVRGELDGAIPEVPAILDNAASTEAMAAPYHEAWASYDSLMASCLTWGQSHPDGVLALCLGPAATVMAWDLGKRGHQAIDLGKAPNFYERRR